MLTCTYEKSSACRGLLGEGKNGYEKAPTGGAIGRWCASWWFFGLGEALYGSGLVGPLELIAELFGYMLKRLDITSDPHDVDEGFRAEFRAVVEGIHLTQQGGIRFAHGGGNVFGTKTAF